MPEGAASIPIEPFEIIARARARLRVPGAAVTRRPKALITVFVDAGAEMSGGGKRSERLRLILPSTGQTCNAQRDRACRIMTAILPKCLPIALPYSQHAMLASVMMHDYTFRQSIRWWAVFAREDTAISTIEQKVLNKFSTLAFIRTGSWGMIADYTPNLRTQYAKVLLQRE